MQPVKNGHTILIGEDEPEVRAYLEMALRCLGYEVEMAQDGDEILASIRSTHRPFSAVLLDLMMPQRDGMEVLREIRRVDPTLPVLIVSGAASTLNVVTAMKSGAVDFLGKPVSHDELRRALVRALGNRTTLAEAPAPPAAARAGKIFFGNGPRMREIQSMAGHVGWSEAPVLIQGETGSGKEVIARELHACSPRAGKVFLKLNCAALPSELVESELFGYERGAFTGAFQKKIGMFEAADGGTILLDEIGDMDFRLQAKLLQVLQDREFQRIGGKDPIRVDVRVIAATHRNLEQAIAEAAFREDLYYRLNVINIQLPPLRERKEDIPLLAEHLLNKHAVPGRNVAITLDLQHALTTYHWPGNVRELENMMRKLIVLRDPALIARELHAKSLRRPLASAAGPPREEPQPVCNGDAADPPILERVTRAKLQAETDAIVTALNSTRWNRKQAAALLKIDYKALLYKMKKLGLDDRAAPLSPVEATQAFTAAGD
jgi:two-component system response regulator AtoC